MKKIKFFSLSTCIWCRKTKQHLDEFGVDYEQVVMDKLEGDEKAAAMEELAKYNPKKSFPTLVFGENNIVVGFKPDDIRAAMNKKE